MKKNIAIIVGCVLFVIWLSAYVVVGQLVNIATAGVVIGVGALINVVYAVSMTAYFHKDIQEPREKSKSN